MLRSRHTLCKPKAHGYAAVEDGHGSTNKRAPPRLFQAGHLGHEHLWGGASSSWASSKQQLGIWNVSSSGVDQAAVGRRIPTRIKDQCIHMHTHTIKVEHVCMRAYTKGKNPMLHLLDWAQS